MKFLGCKNGVYVYAPRKNEPVDGDILDRISDDLKGDNFHYVGIKSHDDNRINGYVDLVESLRDNIDFTRYNLILVIIV